MTETEKLALLSDHVDMRLVAVDSDEPTDRNSVVQLNPDHPGFRDQDYRDRRNRIAQIALRLPGRRVFPTLLTRLRNTEFGAPVGKR